MSCNYGHYKRECFVICVQAEGAADRLQCDHMSLFALGSASCSRIINDNFYQYKLLCLLINPLSLKRSQLGM